MKHLATLLLLVACSKPEAVRESVQTTSSSTGSVAAVSAAPSVSPPPAAAPEPTSLVGAFGVFKASKAKIVGHTSLVLKLEDDQKHKAIFRAAFHAGGSRYRGDIAAYRLGLALGLRDHFAESVPFSMPRDTLRELLNETDRQKLDEDVVVDEHGRVQGALVRWVDGLEMPPFEREPWVSRWKGWLQSPAEVPLTEQELAADFSTMVAFDYLTGNFDRWSGGNVGAVKRGESFVLRYIDNDGAFLDPMPKGPLAASRQRLLATTRFSRSFVEALRTLLKDPEWSDTFGAGLDGKPLLSASVVSDVRARAVETLAQADKSATPFP